MKMQRIVPLMTAALVAGACTGDATAPTAADGALAPAGPRMEGSPTGDEPSYNPTPTPTPGATPADSTALVGRCCQMGGSGG